MKTPKWLTAVADFCDGFAAYVATLLGVIISKAIPLLSSGGAVHFSDLGLNWIRVGIAAVIALIIIGQQEKGGDAAGKRANFVSRMGNALAHGIAWTSILQLGA